MAQLRVIACFEVHFTVSQEFHVSRSSLLQMKSHECPMDICKMDALKLFQGFRTDFELDIIELKKEGLAQVQRSLPYFIRVAKTSTPYSFFVCVKSEMQTKISFTLC